MSSFSNERPKKLVYDFKVGLARLWHGALQREREITPHTWSTKKTLWNGLLGGIQSGTSRGIDGTAPGCWDTWPGQDACWACISGHWPILWELLSHAVWRTHGVGSTYGHATVFISVRRDIIAFGRCRSSISGADRDDTASQGKIIKTFKTNFFFFTRLRSICAFSLVLRASQVLTSNQRFYLLYCVEVKIGSS